MTWFEPFSTLYEWEPPYAKWYLGGKLNVCFNCVDRHVEAGAGDKVAYHWEGEPVGELATITFADLQSGWFASRTGSESSASARELRSGSTWGWFWSSPWRCSRAHALGHRTPSSSAASARTRSRTG